MTAVTQIGLRQAECNGNITFFCNKISLQFDINQLINIATLYAVLGFSKVRELRHKIAQLVLFLYKKIRTFLKILFVGILSRFCLEQLPSVTFFVLF